MRKASIVNFGMGPQWGGQRKTSQSSLEEGLLPEQKQHLAHVLLTELLAFQLASPVQWIDTQHVLFGEQNTKRIIEVGPSDTLVSMAKKTLALRHKTHDTATSTKRQLLYWKKDEKDIRYEADPIPEASASKVAELKATAVVAPAVAVQTPDAPPPAPAAPAPIAIAAAKVEDVPVTAKEIVVTVIAQKLKKTYGEILKENKSIKALVQGKSTLENEIIGDLGAEFGNLPDKAEELEIEALAEQLQANPAFTGQLRKTSTALTTRLFSLKMPGGFNASRARTYLEEKWGLGAGRQNSVFFLASTMQPANRLGSETEAQTFFDTVVQQYSSSNGLSLSAGGGGGAASGGDAGGVVIDSKAMAALAKEQEAEKKAARELYAKQYGIDLNAGERAALKAQKVIDALQEQLDHLNNELGDDFTNGTKPKFSAKKIRRYDSSWNWVMQDVLDTFYSILSGGISKDSEYELINRAILIANRATPRLIKVTLSLLQRDWTSSGEHVKEAKDFLNSVLELSKPGASRPFACYRDYFNTAPLTEISEDGKITYKEVPRVVDEVPPNVFLKTNKDLNWERNDELTEKYHELADKAQKSGVIFKNKNILVTGASPGSIGAEIIRGLVSGGARVIVTTSSYSSKVTRWYQQLYMSYGATGSELIVLPFNQGSQQDIDNLTAFIYDSSEGLGLDLDHIIPFAAISENGREIDGIDSRSELAHRIMLTNTVRLLGAVVKQKKSRGFITRPAQVLLPMSPNHGVFGNDGLYAESKIGLETMFERWHSESWSSYLSICGAVIGWTRGTGLMTDNDIVSSEIEKKGLRTFSQKEMAFYLVMLMNRPIVKHNELEPIYADLTGGMANVPKLKDVLTGIRKDMTEKSEYRRATTSERALEAKCMSFDPEVDAALVAQVQPQANIDLHFPHFPYWDTEIEPLHKTLHGMVDLDRVVVVTGFAEVGPWGNARTRWEMEAYGTFSLDGCIEMAWIMGLIKNHDGPLAGIDHYSGWVDAKTLKPIADSKIKEVYEEEILAHTGVRLVEPALDEGYDPEKKQVLQEIVLEEDLAPFTATKELAADFVREHGDLVDTFELPGGDEFSVKLKKGATLMVPRAFKFDRTVAGQIPTGWDARTYGVEESIISQVDRVTLFALISTVEALLSAGITDPYEIYRYIHVSEIGNCIGSGLGGQMSMKRMLKTRFLDRPVNSDVLQETFINTTAAWINMLVISACGPIRTPVGACATSVESLETGFESIVSGRTKMCLVGGFDDMTEAVAYEFANMKATSNSEAEIAAGRDPKEMCRPTSSTRNGFMEAQGGGIQVITSARLALDMGLPIHGVVAWVGTSSDKIGRSIPAPGKGILTNAREKAVKFPSPLLNIEYRRKRLEMRQRQINECLDLELAAIDEELSQLNGGDQAVTFAEAIKNRRAHIQQDADRQYKEALNTFGNNFYADLPDVSPIRGSLAVWGLTIDDLDIASFHGTSTVKNDLNETTVIQSQLTHLGRNPDTPVFGIFQKNLTGHSKGGAGAWMLNGCLQVLDTGLVPGNRNADNVDKGLEKNDLILYPNKSIQTTGIKAFSVTSFGFGQKGAQAIGVHAKYLYATLSKTEYTTYIKKSKNRQRTAYKFFQKGLATNRMFVAKDQAPYTKEQEAAVLLNPHARVAGSTNDYFYDDQELLAKLV